MSSEPNVQTLGIDRLAVADRFRLLDEIWLSLAAEESSLQVPAWHKSVLDQRLAALEANPGGGSSWEEVEARLSERL
jgi:putative addiction module component (TIGR02574 family)